MPDHPFEEDYFQSSVFATVPVALTGISHCFPNRVRRMVPWANLKRPRYWASKLRHIVAPLTYTPSATNAFLANHLINWKQCLALLLVILIGGAITFIRIQENVLNRGIPPTLDVNVECSPCSSTATSKSYCKELPYQYEKFIWFITDGWAYFRAKEAIESYGNNTILYTHSVRGERWSHAIYTSWFSGLPALNIFGFSIAGDQIWESLSRARGDRCEINDKDLTYGQKGPSQTVEHSPNTKYTNDTTRYDGAYIGPEWAPIRVAGGKGRFRGYYNFDMDIVNEDYEKDPHVYPTLETDNLKNMFDQVLSQNKSLVMHSGLYDKACHKGMVDSYKRKKKEAEYLTEMMTQTWIKEFVDAHPDYLFIMSSDHGNAESNSPGFHGEEHTGTLGNIGYILLYNPQLPHHPLQEIDVVDVAPTLCKYLKNCDIPYHSWGVTQNYYGAVNETTQDAYLTLYKQNLVQLLKTAKYNDVDFDFKKAKKMADTGTVDDLGEIREYCLQLKRLLYDADYAKKVPFAVILLQAAFTMVGLGIITYIWSLNDWNLKYSVVILCPLLALFFALFPTMNTNYFFAYGLWFLGMMVVYGLMNIITKEKRLFIVYDIGMNIILWGLTMVTDSEYADIMAIIVSILYTLHGFVDRRFTKDSLQLKIHLASGLVLILFFLTREFRELYFLFEFHFFALIIYLGALPLMAFFLIRKKWESLYLPFAFLMLLIRNGDPSILFLALNHNYVMTPLVSVTTRSPSVFSVQATAVYVSHQAFWLYGATHSTLDWNVNPNWGSVGMLSWNTYPTISGGLMFLGKIGLFLLCGLYTLKLLMHHKTLFHFASIYFFLEAILVCLITHLVLSNSVISRILQSMSTLLFILMFDLVVWLAYEVVFNRNHSQSKYQSLPTQVTEAQSNS